MKAIDELEQMTQYYANYSNDPREAQTYPLYLYTIKYGKYLCEVLASSEESAKRIFIKEATDKKVIAGFNEDEFFIKKITKERLVFLKEITNA